MTMSAASVNKPSHFAYRSSNAAISAMVIVHRVVVERLDCFCCAPEEDATSFAVLSRLPEEKNSDPKMVVPVDAERNNGTLVGAWEGTGEDEGEGDAREPVPVAALLLSSSLGRMLVRGSSWRGTEGCCDGAANGATVEVIVVERSTADGEAEDPEVGCNVGAESTVMGAPVGTREGGNGVDGSLNGGGVVGFVVKAASLKVVDEGTELGYKVGRKRS